MYIDSVDKIAAEKLAQRQTRKALVARRMHTFKKSKCVEKIAANFTFDSEDNASSVRENCKNCNEYEPL